MTRSILVLTLSLVLAACGGDQAGGDKTSVNTDKPTFAMLADASDALPVFEAKKKAPGEEVEVLWVKGSGGDNGSMKLDGFATLYMDKLNALKELYRGEEFEDEMVGYLPHCTFNLIMTEITEGLVLLIDST